MSDIKVPKGKTIKAVFTMLPGRNIPTTSKHKWDKQANVQAAVEKLVKGKSLLVTTKMGKSLKTDYTAYESCDLICVADYKTPAEALAAAKSKEIWILVSEDLLVEYKSVISEIHLVRVDAPNNKTNMKTCKEGLGIRPRVEGFIPNAPAIRQEADSDNKYVTVQRVLKRR